jgi:hypothetical protein
MSGSAFNPLQDAVAKYVTQADHGFAVGDVLKKTLGGYGLAKADTPENAEVCGIVMEVMDDDSFRLCIEGHIRGLSVTSDVIYWLSAVTAGLMVDTPPSTPGLVQKPVLWTISTTEGLYKNMRGCVVPGTPPSADPVVLPVYKVALTRGSNNDYTGTIADYPTSYQQSPIYVFTTDSGNDVNGVEARVNINSLGWVNLRKRDVPQGASTKLGYYDMSPAGQLPFVYDGTEFQLMTPERKFTFSGQAYYESGDSYTVRRVVISDHPASYVNGYVYNITFTDASPPSYAVSSDELSLKINALAPMVVKKRDSALNEFVKIDNSELKTGRLYQFVCNGTNMILVTSEQKQCYFATSKDTRTDLIDVDIRDYPSAYNGDSFILVQISSPKTGTTGQNLVLFKINSLDEFPIMLGASEFAGEDDFVEGGEVLLKYNSVSGIWCLVGHAISSKLATNMCDIRLSINGSDNPDNISDSGVPSRVVTAHRYKGDKVALWNLASSRWIVMRVPTQFGNWMNPVDTPDTIVMDVSVYYDYANNVVQLMTSAVWADMHTRTEALEVHNGVLVFAGMRDRRYLGTISVSMDNAIILDPDDIVDYLSGGNEDGTTPEEAFDGDSGTYWGSIQEGTEVSGNAFIGYSLGDVFDSIQEIVITQDDADHAIESIKLYSINPDNGPAWTDHGTYNLTKDGNPQSIRFTEWIAAKQFKIVANANPDNSPPGVQEGDNPWIGSAEGCIDNSFGSPYYGIDQRDIDNYSVWGSIPINLFDGNPDSSYGNHDMGGLGPNGHSLITDVAYVGFNTGQSPGVSEIKHLVVKHTEHDMTCPSVEVISFVAEYPYSVPASPTSHGTFAMDPDDTETVITPSSPITVPTGLDPEELFFVVLRAKSETIEGRWRMTSLLGYEFDAPFDEQTAYVPAYYNPLAVSSVISSSGSFGSPNNVIDNAPATNWVSNEWDMVEGSQISPYLAGWTGANNNLTFQQVMDAFHASYIGFDLGSAVTVRKVELTIFGSDLSAMSLWGSADPTGQRDYVLEYSSDGSSWSVGGYMHVVEPYPIMGPVNIYGDQSEYNTAKTICYISTTASAQYWRIAIPTWSSAFGRPWVISQLKMYSYVPASGTPPVGGGGYEPMPNTWRVQDIQVKTAMGAMWTEEKRHLWNYYNQFPVKLKRKIDASDIVCDTNSFVCLGNEMYNTGTTSGMRVDYVVGALNSQMSIEATLLNIADSGNSYEGGHVGIGFNAVSASNVENIADIDGCNPTVSGLQRYNQITARYMGHSPHGTIGLNSLNAIVRTNNSSAETTFNCGDNSGGIVGWISA